MLLNLMTLLSLEEETRERKKVENHRRTVAFHVFEAAQNVRHVGR